MKKIKYDYSVYIGRYQPPHKGHIETIRQALAISEKVIILLGSSNSSMDLKNPFNDFQRKEMILSCFEPQDCERIKIEYIQDRFYQNKHWITDVQMIIERSIALDGWRDKTSVALIGLEKDDSSWYLNSFPQWDFVKVNPHTIEEEVTVPINSTDIRYLYYRGLLPYIKHTVNEPVYEYLREFMQTEEYNTLKKEYEHAVEYENLFKAYPKGWAVNFLTCDAVVLQSGHILLVKRAQSPGKGLWALPGGHVGPNETTEDAMVRELREETSLKVPEKVIKGSIKKRRFFDYPDRSLRGRVLEKKGRTVTMAYGIVLDDTHNLPKVKGASDASEEYGGKAWWFPIGEFKRMREEMFEDHYDIALFFIDQFD